MPIDEPFAKLFERVKREALDKLHPEYRDDTYPERACDKCGTPYRGPAVYCSFACAIADA